MRSRFFPAVFVLLAASLSFAQEDARTAFLHGVELHRAGDLEGAIREYRAALQLDPSNVQALSNLGAALSASGRFDEAIARYQDALKLQPSLPGVRLNLGLAYYKSSRFAAAAREFETVHAAAPADLRTSLLLADCYLRLGRFPQAVALLSPLAAAQPDDRSLDYLLGTALIRSGHADQGQLYIDRILRDPDSAEAHYLLGAASFTAGAFPKAVSEFALALQRKASLPSLQSYYGQALLATGDPGGAETAFRAALAQDPRDFDANLQLASILAQRGQNAGALTLVEAALQARPDSPDAHFARANLLRLTGRTADADREAAYVAATWPDYYKSHQAAPSQQSSFLLNSPAPDFALPRAGSSDTVRLSQFRHRKPVVLVFGSYTCPKFRYGSPALNELWSHYGKQAEFLLVYIREAHGAGGAAWQSTPNQRAGVALPDPPSPSPK